MAIDEQALAQPDVDHAIEAWYMDDLQEDQRKPHRRSPNEPVSLEKLRELGVLSWKIDADNYTTDSKLAAIRNVRGYTYQDIVDVRPETLPDYENKLKIFYMEHIHADEEIRCILDGTGYFDVRDLEDRWIRIAMSKGDMIVLPAGIYHRFTLDENNYGKALRLFVGEPVWTPYNRPQEEHQARLAYLKQYGQPVTVQ